MIYHNHKRGRKKKKWVRLIFREEVKGQGEKKKKGIGEEEEGKRPM